MNIIKYTKQNIKQIINKIGPKNFAILLITFVILCFILYNIYKLLYPHKESFSSNSDSSLADKQSEVLFYYADWCHHCKDAKPEWYALKEKYKKKTINGYHMIFTEIDCSTTTDENSKKMKKFNVNGFPTIILLKDDKVIHYESKPTKDLLSEFLENNL